ncbi:putative bifunctional diguanylate cyclase/phosphodiesterase [Methylovirgula sp. 4M-Z18]|uniref:putative bifunctional diguanylate cyclase/phosphodiesterase n=1 Tax=Methylovirgula sp. 4M-Z18 TaxID=2293567 RepID=UPI000E2E982F|nr:EAL domain-containing protein [Methylovirgula sp. 4M-Z18]RFB79849.1 EAL domain-containing protein [Methylovirgula sp. 4M-Z18]
MQEDSLKARIVSDQVRDVEAGLFVSMPTSTLLSGMLFFVDGVSGRGVDAVIWFLAISIINFARIIVALRGSILSTAGTDGLSAEHRRLRSYKVLAALAGLAWAYIAVLTDGFTSQQTTLHLIILVGVSAGAAIYSSSCAALSINFFTVPISVAIVCLLWNGGMENDVLAIACVLFLGGVTRGAMIVEKHFREICSLRYLAVEAASEMERRSLEDPLTGLLNRRGLERTISRLKSRDLPLITMLIDLDGFKSINDTYGHAAGDNLLVMLTHRLQAIAPSGATISRIGGDEFILIFHQTGEHQDVSAFASSLIFEICRPYPSIASVRIGACVGIYQSGKPNLTEMLLRADTALYKAKSLGRNEFYFFDAALDHSLERRQCIERDVKMAIENGNLKNWFQPIVKLPVREVVGFEALLRWSHPVHGNISPLEAISAARETGQLPSLTEAIFRNCCAMVEALLQAGHGRTRVAMNISPKELETGSIDDMILSGLESRSLPASMFEIEITEEAPIDVERVHEKLERLIRAGVSISLDDFGIGFSTLASLKDGRFSKVKIDKHFILGLSHSPKDQMLVKTVIDLGRSLTIEVGVEGVESQEDLDTLQSLGCSQAQGFLFARPLPLPEAVAILSKGGGDLPLSLPFSFTHVSDPPQGNKI